jgi:hypothetical protein
MVRMHAGCRKQHTAACFGQLRRSHVALIARARHDHRGDTGGRRTLHHGVAIVVETVVREIRANVNE